MVREFLVIMKDSSGDNRQLATGNRQPVTGNRQPATGNGQLSPFYQSEQGNTRPGAFEDDKRDGVDQPGADAGKAGAEKIHQEVEAVIGLHFAGRQQKEGQQDQKNTDGIDDILDCHTFGI